MPIEVKNASDSAAKWSQRASGASADYAQGATAAADVWARNAAAAAGNYKAAVSAGGIDQRFVRGIQAAGAAKYQRKVSDVGAGRYSSGVSAAQNDYAQGVTPYLQTIQGLTLPPRQPRGSAANLQRVSMIADALYKRRVGQTAAGR